MIEAGERSSDPQKKQAAETLRALLNEIIENDDHKWFVGKMSAEEFDAFVRDTTNFLAFIAEPIRQDRRKIGLWVLIFLIFFFVLAVQLKKEIWKDVK